MGGYAVEQHTVDGLPGWSLSGPGGLVATFVPDAGMVGCSLTFGGREVLGLRGGMSTYRDHGSTFGIPLLAPWANRLGDPSYRVGDRQITVTGVPGVHLEENGLPIHGLLAAARGWALTESGADDRCAHLVATLPFDHDRPEFPAFPFQHDLTVRVEVADNELTVTTTLTPTGGVAVPVAFGWHPYFCLPGEPRAQWDATLPFTRRVELDARSLPTGAVVDVRLPDGPMADHTYDDLFAGVVNGTRASVSGGGLRVSLTYVEGYPYAVVFAPAGQDLIAIEPMTAPTDPFSGTFALHEVGPGKQYTATFAISVEEV